MQVVDVVLEPALHLPGLQGLVAGSTLHGRSRVTRKT